MSEERERKEVKVKKIEVIAKRREISERQKCPHIIMSTRADYKQVSSHLSLTSASLPFTLIRLAMYYRSDDGF